MKKNQLYAGLVYLGVGILFGILALLFDTKIEYLLWGYVGAAVFGGLFIIGKYLYWSRPGYSSEYEKRLEAEKIEFQDERKEFLRNKSGRYAYLLNLLFLSVAMVLVSILDAYGISISTNTIILSLGIYFVFQFVIGVVFFRVLSRKY